MLLSAMVPVQIDQSTALDRISPVGSIQRSQHDRFAQIDPNTGIYSSSAFPNLRFPSDLTIDQFMLSYSPEEAIRADDEGEGHVRTKPDNQTWLIDSHTGKTYTFEECKRRVEELSSAFYRGLDVRPNRVIVVYSQNEIDYPIVIWAAFRAGAIISAANPSYTLSELTYQLKTISKHYTVSGLVTQPESFKVARQAASEVGLPLNKILLMSSKLATGETPEGIPKEVRTLDRLMNITRATVTDKEDLLSKPPANKLRLNENKERIAFLSFSSGTTGVPKAVCITHYSIISNIIIVSRHDNLDVSGQRTLAVLPYYHIFGLVIVMHAGLYRNLTNVVMSRFVFEDFIENLIRHRISIMYLVPSMVVLLTKHPVAAKRRHEIRSSLRRILSGAAPMTQELVQTFNYRFPETQLAQAYGMTETATQVTSRPADVMSPPGSSAGVLGPNISIKIMRDGKPRGFDELGEIWVKSPSNAMGYLGAPEATRGTFTSDGWVRTGDEAFIDQFGWLYVVDRVKELIKVKGNQVAPAELEGCLLEHPAVEDVGVIGIPDEYSGELPRAYIVRNQIGLEKDPSTLCQELSSFVSEKKIKYKWLEGGIAFVESIPKNPSGKILRRKLRDDYKSSQSSQMRMSPVKL